MQPEQEQNHTTLPAQPLNPEPPVSQATTTPPTTANVNPQPEALNQAGTPNITPRPPQQIDGMGMNMSGFSQPVKKKRPLAKLIIIIALVVLLSLGGGAYAYMSMLNNSPEKVLADAFANTTKDILDEKPVQLLGTLKVESKDSASPYTITIDIDSKQVGGNGQFDATVNFKAGESFEVTIKSSVVSEGASAAYIKLTDLQKTVDQVIAAEPELGMYGDMFKPIIAKIDGKWIKIDESGVAEYGVVESEEAATACSDAVGNLRISEDDKSKFKDIFSRNQFAIASEELAGEAVEGDESFHYKLDLNEAAAVTFAKELIELESFNAVQDACELTQEKLDEELAKIQETNNDTSKANPVFELWVSKEARRITKVKMTASDTEVTMDGITTVKIDAPDLTVEIPTDFITLQQLSDEISAAFQEGNALGITIER